MSLNYELRPSHRLILYAISRSRSVNIEKLVEAFGLLFPEELGSYSDVENVLKGLQFVGLVELSKGTIRSGNPLFVGLPTFNVYLTDEGERIAQSIYDGRNLILRPRKERQKTVFVASAFGYDEIDKLYKNEFVPACHELGYKSVRMDLIEPEQTITESIMQSIIESACVFVDLTHARPSVYFEAGFAHGLGIPLIITCRSDHFKGKEDNARVHFDLEQFRISFWTLSKDDKFSWQKGMSPVERLTAIVPKN
jgi:hypothetical protein